MAADPSIDESEGAPPVPIDEKPSPPRELSSGPPRPPRPAKRASGSLRIPLPSAVAAGSKPNGAARAHAPLTPVSSTPSSAPASEPPIALSSGLATPVPPVRASSTWAPPAVITPAAPSEPAANIEFQLTRRSSAAPALRSAAPPLSFDSAEVDPSDRAPGAPFTPWRDVPRTREPAALESLPAPTADRDHDHEETIVGKVANDLLEQSSDDGEEHTRAYQAPQELIELARRQREERRQAKAGPGRKRDAKAAFHDSLPPTARRPPEDDEQSDLHTATVPVDPAADAAPPVELSRPARASAAPRGGQPGRSAAPSLSELAREISERRRPGSLSPVGDGQGRPGASESAAPPSLVNFQTPWLTRGRIWALLAGLFIAMGYALARWRGLDLLR